MLCWLLGLRLYEMMRGLAVAAIAMAGGVVYNMQRVVLHAKGACNNRCNWLCQMLYPYGYCMADARNAACAAQ